MIIRRYVLSVIAIVLIAGSTKAFPQQEYMQSPPEWYSYEDLQVLESEYQRLNGKVKSNEASFGSPPTIWSNTYSDLIELESYYYKMLPYFQRMHNSNVEEVKAAEGIRDRYAAEYNEYKTAGDKLFLDDAEIWLRITKKNVKYSLEDLTRTWDGIRKVEVLINQIKSTPPSQRTTPTVKSKTPSKKTTQPSGDGDTLLKQKMDEIK